MRYVVILKSPRPPPNAERASKDKGIYSPLDSDVGEAMLVKRCWEPSRARRRKRGACWLLLLGTLGFSALRPGGPAREAGAYCRTSSTGGSVARGVHSIGLVGAQLAFTSGSCIGTRPRVPPFDGVRSKQISQANPSCRNLLDTCPPNFSRRHEKMNVPNPERLGVASSGTPVSIQLIRTA